MLAGWPVLVEPALDAVVVTVEPVTVPVGSPPFFVGDRNCFLAATTAESVCALCRTSFARLFKALSAEQDVLSLLHSLPVGSVWFRSEELRVGKDCVRRCRYGWSQY